MQNTSILTTPTGVASSSSGIYTNYKTNNGERVVGQRGKQSSVPLGSDQWCEASAVNSRRLLGNVRCLRILYIIYYIKFLFRKMDVLLQESPEIYECKINRFTDLSADTLLDLK